MDNRPTKCEACAKKDGVIKLVKTAIDTFFHHWKHGGISRDNQFHQNTAWHMRVAAENINAISAPSAENLA